MRQVITFHPDGTVSGLQRRRGEGLDLTRFGHASVERASTIEWDETLQGWTVRPLVGPLAKTGMMLTSAEMHRTTGARGYDQPRVLVFASYDDAVEREVQYLDALRLRGEL